MVFIVHSLMSFRFILDVVYMGHSHSHRPHSTDTTDIAPESHRWSYLATDYPHFSGPKSEFKEPQSKPEPKMTGSYPYTKSKQLCLQCLEEEGGKVYNGKGCIMRVQTTESDLVRLFRSAGDCPHRAQWHTLSLLIEYSHYTPSMLRRYRWQNRESHWSPSTQKDQALQLWWRTLRTLGKPNILAMPQVSKVQKWCSSPVDRDTISFSTLLPNAIELSSHTKLSTTSSWLPQRMSARQALAYLREVTCISKAHRAWIPWSPSYSRRVEFPVCWLTETMSSA